MTHAASTRPLAAMHPRLRSFLPLALFVLSVLSGSACSGEAQPRIAGSRQALKGPPGPGPTPGPAPDPVCPAPSPNSSPFPPDLGAVETASAGTISGAFSVTPTGDARYVLPLLVPPGRVGVQPTLAITYDGAAEGPLGVGFSISGLSVVTRCPKNMAQDGTIAPVVDDDTDALCLDGQRLVKVGEGAEGVEYRTFPDTFVKILAQRPHGWDPSRGPQSLRAFTKEGLILDYGAEPSGRALAKNGAVRAWWVTRASDRSGNFIRYTYLNEKNLDDSAHPYTTEILPDRITYTGHAGVEGSRAVVFGHVPRAATRTSFVRGMKMQNSRHLSTISTLGPDNSPVREYRLAYDASATTGRARLSSIEECAPGGPCKPPTRFGWSTPKTGFAKISTQLALPGSALGAVLPMDLDGDGLDDIVTSDVERVGDMELPVTHFLVAKNGGPDASSPFPAKYAHAYMLEHYGQIPLPVQPELGTPIDHDQDGRMDLFLHDVHGNATTWRLLRTEPDGTFEKQDTGVARPFGAGQPVPKGLRGPSASAHLADMDGDGVADLVQCEKVATGYAWTLWPWTPGGFAQAPQAIGALDVQPCDSELHPLDLDADGKTELLVPEVSLGADGVPLYKAWYVGVRYEGPGSFSVSKAGLPSVPAGGATFFLDVNGDGLPDALQTGFGDGVPRTFLNTGDGFGSAVQSLPAALPGANKYARLATSLEFDGDGWQDLLLPMEVDGPVPTWAILRSQGDGTFAAQKAGIPFDVALSQAGVTIADPRGPRVFEFDGDGAHDVLLPVGGALQVFRNEARHPDVLVTITDGMSAYPDEKAQGYRPSVSIAYGTLVDRSITSSAPPSALGQEKFPYLARHDAANECDYPVRCVVGPRRVVTGYTLDTAAAEPRHFALRYRDARWHRLGRGFLGFAERITLDLDTGAGAIEAYDNRTYDPDLQAFPFAGHVVRALGWSHDDKPQEADFALSFSSTMHQVAPTSGGATYFTLPVYGRQWREQGTIGLFDLAALFGSHEAYAREAFYSGVDTERLSESIRVVFDYDLHGGVLAEKAIAGKDLANADPETVEEITRDFDANEAKWLIGKLRLQTHCSTAGEETLCRRLDRKYDALGRVDSVGWGTPGDPETQVSISFARDAFGNVTKAVAVDAFEGRRASCTSYELEGVFPYAQKNAEGHLSYSKFHPGLGVPVARVDPNGLATQWAYDRFGRVGKEKRLDGTETSTTLSRKKKGGLWGIEVTTTSTGAGTEVSELDPLGRVVRQWSPGVQTPQVPNPPRILREVEFDFLGEHVHRLLSPVAETAPEDERHYDVFTRDASGRVVKHVSPWNATTLTQHEGAKIRVIDPRGGQTITTLDGHGRPSVIEDAEGGETRYAYGPFGGLFTVTDPAGAVTTTERDAFGRVRLSKDPDRGEAETHYSGFGEVWWTRDARGRRTWFAMDRLGRRVERTDEVPRPDGTIETSVTTWKWDGASNGVGALEVSVSPGGHALRYGYDGLGRPAKTELAIGPDAFEVQYGYDGQGRLATITYPDAGGSPFAVERIHDAAGHLVEVRDVATQKAYWTLTAADGAGRITGERFGNDVETLRSYFEERDRVEGIFTQRNGKVLQDLGYAYDKNQNLTMRADHRSGETEHFGHDALDRLDCAHFDGEVPCVRAWSYEADGNLLNAPELGAYAYADPAHPHAVTAAGKHAFAHDAVGNQIARDGAAIDYTPFDQPWRIKTPGGAVFLDYDAEGARIRKTAAGAVTVYLGGLYERVTHASGLVEHRYYVSSGERPVAVVTRPSVGAASTVYLHVDHLGSVEVVTDAAGVEIERRGYEPFGAKRGPPHPAATTLGFTGHEADDELGLVHMKGRLYDPVIGRFLTPDPIVSEPLSGQGWNPYSYVGNNPLAYVDPSGFSAVEVGESGAPEYGTGFVLGTAGQPETFFDTLTHSEIPVDANFREGIETGALRQSADFGSVGVAPGFVPAQGPAGAECTGVSGGRGVVGDIVQGVLIGLEDLALGLAMSDLVPSALPLAYANRADLVSRIEDGHEESGALGVANVFNPVAPLVGGVQGAVQAAEDGDRVGLARHATGLVAMVVAAVLTRGQGGVAAGEAEAAGFGGLKHAARFGIRPYGELRVALKGTGLRAHHLIEQRFKYQMGQKSRDMLSVAVTKEEHQVLTNHWRKEISYGSSGSVSLADVRASARRVYHNHPAIRRALGL